MTELAHASRAEATGVVQVDRPVFVLCNGRSGSTLLRFLLDAHPELACPPETNLPGLCVQLATVWSLIEGAPLSAVRGDEPPEVPHAAIAGVRATMDSMVGPYLARRGKRRYCDKSLGTARFAELLTRVYPEARFVCLYRHPMDVIASGMEACPWGLSGYGFDPYIAATPGNAVLALARFWAENAAETLAAEDRFPGACLRVRYEDLVAAPDQVAGELFGFLGAAPAPGISAACFSTERERFGPADHKIWYTSKISSDSVGRGWSVPAGMIPPPVREQVNQLAARLGYLPVDGGWGTSAPPADLRTAQTRPQADPAQASSAQVGPAQVGPAQIGPAQVGPAQVGPAQVGPAQASTAAAGGHRAASQRLGDRLKAGLAELGAAGGPDRAESFVAVWLPADQTGRPEHWLVDLKNHSVTLTGAEAQENSDWDIVGSAQAWEQVTGGQLNLGAALRSCRLRYCDGAESGPVASDARIAMLARLLDLASW
jgi:hypothetical protein